MRYQKVLVISFVHLKKLCRFANFGGCRSEIGLATPNLVLRLKLGMPFLLLNNEITLCRTTSMIKMGMNTGILLLDYYSFRAKIPKISLFEIKLM